MYVADAAQTRSLGQLALHRVLVVFVCAISRPLGGGGDLGGAALAAGFELYAEEQLLPLAPLFEKGQSIPGNESEFGSTHVDDYWSQLDSGSGSETGRSVLSRHVRIGCFVVRSNSFEAHAEESGGSDRPPTARYWRPIPLTSSREDCVEACVDSVQVYFRSPAECLCGESERGLQQSLPLQQGAEPQLEEAVGKCPASSWELFREYDYRSSMSPSTYDVARHLLYQIVTVRVPQADPSGGIRHYLRAVDGVQAAPRFQFDTRLDRMIFNVVWDFGKSRMVALSFPPTSGGGTGAALDLTVVAFNTSFGGASPIVTQEHYPIQEQIYAAGELLSAGLASADGMGTVDVLFGTYYTVVPASAADGSGQVVHVIVAIDIETQRVLRSAALPVTLMNLQINALQHVLYGAGADLSGRYAYFELCRAGVAGSGEVNVDCHYSELGALPPVVNHMYLQSASIDHQLNYAWFAYKQVAAGRPQILEYHHDSADYSLWHEEALHPEVAFASLVQPSAGPQLVFSLKPPVMLHARFAPSGERLRITFDSSTLRGAAPLDGDRDGVPDFWEEPPEGDRVPCEWFFDDQTALALGVGGEAALCEWSSASELLADVSPRARLAPGDEVRLRGGAIFAAGRSPSGVSVFSPAASGSVMTEPPEELLVPRAVIKVSNCEPDRKLAAHSEDLVLDGSASSGHGSRGAFVWSISSMDPPPSPATGSGAAGAGSDVGLVALERAFAVATTAATAAAAASGGGGPWPQVLTIPAAALTNGTTYHFSLTVTSFFDPSVSATTTRSVLWTSGKATANANAAPAPACPERSSAGGEADDVEALAPVLPPSARLASTTRKKVLDADTRGVCNASSFQEAFSARAPVVAGPPTPPKLRSEPVDRFQHL